MARYLPSWRTTTVLSSLILRLSCFVFLRWIPGHHFPPVILAVFILYLAGFVYVSRPKVRLQPRDPADVVNDRYEAAYARVQQNRQRRDEQVFLIRENSLPEDSAPGTPSSQRDRPEHDRTSPFSLRRESTLTDVSTSSEQRTQTPPVAPDQRSETPPGVRLASDGSLAGITETILTGLPNRASWLWSATTLLINLMLVLMVADLVLRAPLFYGSEDLAFTRTGFVDERAARIMVRDPDPVNWPLTISYRTTGSKRWMTFATVPGVDESTDYTHTFKLDGLRPATQYEWMSSNGQNGTFTTAPRVGHSRLTFLTSSCLKPRVPYHPRQHPLEIPGLDHLAALLPRLHASFMLFLGDFIYIDVPRRMGYGAKTYRREYRQVYASPSWPGVNTIPWLHVIDDHEIANDWDAGKAAPYPAAFDPFAIYHHAANPPTVGANTTYYAFRHGPASFFMLDTRRHRTPSQPLAATSASKTMLGAAQRAAVLAWLTQPEPAGVRWKFLVSSVPLTRNWRANAHDTWAGYLWERQILLEAMWDAAARGYGVAVLSGDRHEFAATRFPAPPTPPPPPPGRSRWGDAALGNARWTRPRSGVPVAVYEFSCSPLSMFYLPVRTYRARHDESSGVGAGGVDEMIAYIPDGNSKVGVVDLGVDAGASVLRYRLFIDGRAAWAYGVASDGREGTELGMGLVEDDTDL